MLRNKSHCDKSNNRKIARRNDKMSKIINFLNPWNEIVSI